MQTFLPIESFRESAAVLDNKRLGKQRVECKQILLCLGVPVGEHKPHSSKWRNHPAVKMWAGYELPLVAYSAVVCREWRRRGFQDTLFSQFMALWNNWTAGRGEILYPPWFGQPAFHASHRSNLLRKDFDHYSKFGWTEPPNLPYFWPSVTAEPNHAQSSAH